MKGGPGWEQRATSTKIEIEKDPESWEEEVDDEGEMGWLNSWIYSVV